MESLENLTDPATAAVIVVDVQNDFCHPEGALGRAGVPTESTMAMIPTLATLLAGARASGTPVIWVQTIHEDATDSEAWSGRRKAQDLCRKDTWGAAFTDVAPLPDEPVVIKHRYSGFVNTRLDSVLRTFTTRSLIMTGVSTNVCVESTARHGFMLDYHILFVSDCTAAPSQAEHDGALKNIARNFGLVATAHDIVAAWDARTPVGAGA
jgi:ureidoacrylate peracid hydrolase